MNMVFCLVKKDFLLVRKALPLVLAFVIVYPIVYAVEFEPKEAIESMGPVIFGPLASLCTFMVYHNISLEEQKHRGTQLLAATPYGRRKIVIAKYLTLLVTYIMIATTYVAISKLIPFEFPRVDWRAVSIVFLCLSVFLGVYLLMAFKFGYAKVQVVGYLLVFATPILISRLKRWAESGIISLRLMESLSTTGFGLTALALGALIGMISCMISIGIFERKDL